ncbi:PAS domain-containing sensor histidine kinase [Bradyrhizobium sp. WD16]|uniref:hybrid sensor histidine kinase/response regulator n=1 Tax=Bradyrhizobium sp. WD16 TaxID=1521768 RepID=UPI002112C5DC|nr:PAS domain-containing sensor histidine kinase [Bradyrhizobium sp. WD16]UTD29245.1 hybrid sensor histidine kinase/response regulator [Bradyrhizobium sp. WD16]
MPETWKALQPVKGVQSDLYASERIFRQLVEGVVDYAIFMLDPSGIVANWNSGAERIKGYAAAEVVGTHYSRFFTAEDRDKGIPARNLDQARRYGRFEADGWRVRKDGSRFFANVVVDAIYEDGELIGFAKIIRDITERRRAERELYASEDRFRLLVSGVADYALYMLDPAGIVTNWHAGGERIKGYSADEIVGQHFSRFYTEADRAAGRPARALQIARDTGKYEEEGWRVRKDGSFFWASVVLRPIHADDSTLLGFAKITRDITERHEAEQKLEAVQRQLAESQKLDALGQLTGGVAHDFNNLLMIVAGNLPALARVAQGDPRAERAVRAVERVAERGAALTHQLLSFARRQQVHPKTVSVGEGIRAVGEVLRAGLGAAHSLQIDVASDPWPVTVDPSEFQTALVNLVVNARDAMAGGGIVDIRAGNAQLKEENLSGDFVAITVADSGAGIPPDVIDRVFDPFFTTKPVGKGTGLGLSQVHGFVHQAGGTVRLESEFGKGTSVTILLPRSEAEAGAHQSSARAPAHAGTVLLVEDNPDVAFASTALFEQLGYSVSWAADADAALDELKRGHFDIVFSDVVMPGRLDGIGLARAIRQTSPEIPILLATGYSPSSEATMEFPILRKPYQIHDLSKALGELRHRAETSFSAS